MRRAFGDYSAYIFDLDGTLYYQRAMRLRMLLLLLGHVCRHPGAWRELRALRIYRSLREDSRMAAGDGADGRIVAETARRAGLDAPAVRRIVTGWMIDRPLQAVARSADRTLLRTLDRLVRAGKRVYVYSDYPADKKCAALGVRCGGLYAPDGEHIRRLKPDPQGLSWIMTENALTPDETLMIGNRDDKDGAAARAAGVDCLILSNSRLRRALFYRRGSLNE